MTDVRYIRLRDTGESGDAPFLNIDTLWPEQPKFKKLLGTSGLRRQILVLSGGELRETFDQFPITDTLLPHLVKNHSNYNGWNYDYPNLPIEHKGDSPAREHLKAKLEKMCAHFPYEFKIVGLQRRFLLYYSDGNYESQRIFLRLCEAPHHSENPFSPSWRLLPKFAKGATLDQVRHHQGLLPEYTGPKLKTLAGRPLLYAGPAWVVRFEVDGQNPAFQGCRVYVRDDGHFICSDWCQRDGGDVKYGSGGIDLQQGKYTFDSWILGPCLKRAAQQGVFKPKSVVSSKHTEIRTVLKSAVAKKSIEPIPAFEHLLKKREPVIPLLVAQGLADDAIVAELTARLKQAVAGKLPELHAVPVKISDGQPEAVRVKYAHARVDGAKSTTSYLFLLDVAKTGATMVGAKYLEIDAARVALIAAGYRSKAATTTPPPEVLTADAIAEAEARFRDMLAGRKAVNVPATPVLFAHATQATCDACQLRVEDGKVVQGHLCMAPADGHCLFQQHGVTVPPPVRMGGLSYPEVPKALTFKATMVAPATPTVTSPPPGPSAPMPVAVPAGLPPGTCTVCHLTVKPSGEVASGNKCYAPEHKDCYAHGATIAAPAKVLDEVHEHKVVERCGACMLEIFDGVTVGTGQKCYYPGHADCLGTKKAGSGITVPVAHGAVPVDADIE